jgi:hypothetical protein
MYKTVTFNCDVGFAKHYLKTIIAGSDCSFCSIVCGGVVNVESMHFLTALQSLLHYVWYAVPALSSRYESATPPVLPVIVYASTRACRSGSRA